LKERVVLARSGSRGEDIPVFLLNVFAKNEKTDLSPKERRVMRTVLAGVARAFKSRRN
jgi:hypothetical protein